MAGNTPITTPTGIGLRGPATIAAARTQAMAVAAIAAVLPVVVDPVEAVAAVVAATQVEGTIITIHRRRLLLQYLAIRAGAQVVERVVVIERHPHQYIAVPKHLR